VFRLEQSRVPHGKLGQRLKHSINLSGYTDEESKPGEVKGSKDQLRFRYRNSIESDRAPDRRQLVQVLRCEATDIELDLGATGHQAPSIGATSARISLLAGALARARFYLT
jgi:hypothetical protein